MAAMNPGIASRTPSYLWISSSSSSSTSTLPIVDLMIVRDPSITLPKDYILLNKNVLSADSSLAKDKAYICYRRGTDRMPIGTIYILNKGDKEPSLCLQHENEDPLEILQDPILDDASSGTLVRLCFKRVNAEATGREGLFDKSSLRVNDLVDVDIFKATTGSSRCQSPCWVVGEVISTEGDTVVVRQRGSDFIVEFLDTNKSQK